MYVAWVEAFLAASLEIIEVVLGIFFLHKAFITEEVVEMLEEVVYAGQEAQWVFWMRNSLVI